MDTRARPFEVVTPRNHVVISFPSRAHAVRAMDALDEVTFSIHDVRYYSDLDMLERIDQELAVVGAQTNIGEELELVRAQRKLAELGFHWLVVRARNDGRAYQIADRVREFGAERAQYYGRCMIEELIRHVPFVAGAEREHPPSNPTR
jgi:hypothetical protein